MGRFRLPAKVRTSNISKVVEELKELHDSLCKIEQDEFESLRVDLDPVARRLVESELINNGDKSVRLLVSCCLSNILRLYAPDAPYPPDQLKVTLL